MNTLTLPQRIDYQKAIHDILCQIESASQSESARSS